MGLYSTGKMSGLVLDSGHDLTELVPIHDGSIMHHAHGFSHQAGAFINRRLLKSYDLTVSQVDELKCDYLDVLESAQDFQFYGMCTEKGGEFQNINKTDN